MFYYYSTYTSNNYYNLLINQDPIFFPVMKIRNNLSRF